MLEDPFGWVEKQQERCYWRRVGFVAFIFLMVVIFTVLVLLPRKARAEDSYSAKDGVGNVVTIKDKPCPDTPEWLHLRSADMTYNGAKYKACWFQIQGHVIVLDSSGDVTPIPMQSFTKDVGV